MTRLSLAFFSAAVLCVLGGMSWGAYMGSTENFTLMPAHAHLNLVGWASLGLMGTFYQLSGKTSRLGWINFFISVAAVVVMIPSLALYLGGSKSAAGPLAIGSVLAIVGMLTFAASVLSEWKTATR